MNAGRVILGGLLAGLVWNIGEFILNVPVLGEDWEAAYAALGFPADESPAAVAFFVVWTFVAGILAVWLYAALRPRFGPGPRTAVLAGLFVWAIGYGNFAVFNEAVGLFPKNITRLTLVWALFEVPIATLLGAWLYREQPAAAVPTVEARG